MMVEYSFFIDSKNDTIGVVVDDEDSMSIDEYNALDDKGKPTLMELIELLLESFPETIDDFRERLVLIDDPEWDIREQLVFIRGDGGEDIINQSFKSARADIEMSAELLPGITYKQLFKNTLNYNPTKLETASEKTTENDEDAFLLSKSAGIFSTSAIIAAMKRHPVTAGMVIVAFFTFSIGVYTFQATPNTIILPPDRLQQAAIVDQHLNELKVNVDKLWGGVKSHLILNNKEKGGYWKTLKPLNLQYRELRRSGFGHGTKFKAVNDTLKKIKARLRPIKKKKKTKVVKARKPGSSKQATSATKKKVVPIATQKAQLSDQKKVAPGVPQKPEPAVQKKTPDGNVSAQK
jgi:hypothetical protein